MKHQLTKRPFFIILLPVFYLLHMVTEYFPMLKPVHLLLPVTAWMIGIPALVFIIIRYIRPSLLKYAVLFFYLEIIFFFFGPMHATFEQLIPVLAHYKYLVILLLTGCSVLFFISRKKPAIPLKLFLYLNTLFLVLIIIDTGEILYTALPAGLKNALRKQDAIDKLPLCDTCQKPDIYFVVFDEYSGSDALKSYWGYNNNSLDSFFITRHFHYALHTKSNYNFTSFSIASILNMDYHDMKFDEKIDLLLYCKGAKLIENNGVCRLLQRLNYTIINQSFFPVPGDEAHQNISYLSNKTQILMAHTLATKIVSDIGWNFGIGQSFLNRHFDEDQIKNDRSNLLQTQNAYKNLLQISARQNNNLVFVYAHFMLPHSPYFYDSTGHITPEQSWIRYQAHEKEYYLSQLKYTNTVIKNVATHLMTEGKRPRIIIIQSDHGFRSFAAGMEKLEFNNLNAIYFPDNQYAGLYDSMSSVNIFRVILHKYFNAPLPLLKDSTVYIRH